MILSGAFVEEEGDVRNIEGKEVVGCSDITLSPPRWLLLNQEGLRQEFTNSGTYWKRVKKFCSPQ